MITSVSFNANGVNKSNNINKSINSLLINTKATSEKIILSGISGDGVNFGGSIGDFFKLKNKKSEYELREEFLAREDFIEQSRVLSVYKKLLYSINSPYREDYNTVYWSMLQRADLKKLQELDTVGNEIIKHFNIEDLESKKVLVRNLLELYNKNPDAYNYVLNSDILCNKKSIFNTVLIPSDTFKTLNIALLKEIEKAAMPPLIKEYIVDKDIFLQDAEKVSALSSFLSKNTTTGPIVVYKGENHTGMFDSVRLDDKILSYTIKLENKLKNFVTMAAALPEYKEGWHHNLYDYINSKQELSLADAMLFMQYLPKWAQKRVLNKINATKITDSKMISTSMFSFNAYRNVLERDNATVFNKINLPAGIQGRCFGKDGLLSARGEFLLNSGEKTYAFRNAKYYPEKNVFSIESDIQL